MQKPKLTLYHYWRSSCSWRVRWALELKQIACEFKHIDLLKKEHQSPEYLSMNPSGFVPCMVISDTTYGESLAIIEWLDEIYPQNPLLPNQAQSKIIVRQLAYTIASGTQPLQNLSAQKYYSDIKEEQSEYARHWISKGLTIYEKLLQQHQCSGTFSFGAQVTLADLCLIPQCYNAERFGLDIKNWPLIERIYENASSSEACLKSAPHNYLPSSDKAI